MLALPALSLWLPPLVGCGKPAAPLAHLSGQAWVTGAYEHYGAAYQRLQTDAEDQTSLAYAVLAQKGVTALDGLQRREVPFHVRVDEAGDRFAIHRDVPERLTFTASMDAADRERANRLWQKARAHIHTDYAEIARLNWALMRMLEQLWRIRSAIDAAETEQFRLTRQLAEIEQGELPFELPRDVTPAAYALVVLLLVDRLEDDRTRLTTLETQILATGLAVRSADDGSASLSANLRRVLMAIVRDTERSTMRATAYPGDEERARLIANGRKLVVQISHSADYESWLEAERDAWLGQLGTLLSLVDAATGVPVSAAYNKAITIFKGDADYLDYLSLVASFAPSPELRTTLDDALTLTRKVRSAYRDAGALADGDMNAALGGLINTGTDAARHGVDKQLSFFHDGAELEAISAELDDTALMRATLPVP
jgi:hypothetical protein